MPNYIPGLADFAPPFYEFKNLKSATFVVDADPNKLKVIVDTFLNGPLNRTAANDVFVPGGSQRVLVCCSTFPDVRAPGVPLGYSAYTEVTLIFSVFDHRRKEWSWYAPVLYLDGPPEDTEEWQAELPIAVGREMYGLPKTRGDLKLETTFFTGTIDHIDPAVSGFEVSLADSIAIDLGMCATPTLNDEIAVEETEALGLVIEEFEARIKQLPRRKINALRRKISKLRKRIAKLTVERDRIARDRHEAMLDLIRQRDNPGERELLSPQRLIEMFWGGDPYQIVGVPRPHDDEEWLASLGFIRRDRRTAARGTTRKKRGRRVLMLTTGDPSEPEPELAGGPPEPIPPEPTGDYDLQFYLLGLRQLHDPDPTKFGQAALQQVVRTKLRFNQLPFKPGQFYCIDIKDSPVARWLGIGPTTQTILPINNFAYSGATAYFGEDAQIIT